MYIYIYTYYTHSIYIYITSWHQANGLQSCPKFLCGGCLRFFHLPQILIDLGWLKQSQTFLVRVRQKHRKVVSSCMFWIRCMKVGNSVMCKHMESTRPKIVEAPCPEIWVQSCPWCFSRARGQTTTSAQNLWKKDFARKMKKDKPMNWWRLLVQPQAKWAWPRVTDCLISGAVIARKLESAIRLAPASCASGHWDHCTFSNPKMACSLRSIGRWLKFHGLTETALLLFPLRDNVDSTWVSPSGSSFGASQPNF